MPPVPASVAENHNSIGDLVPMHQKLLSQPGVQKFVEVLMQQLLQQDEKAVDKKWEVLDSPISDREHLKLNAPAYTCVVQLPGSAGIVGVFKIACNGNCTLFLRMNRAHLDAWCERNSEQKNRKRIFRRLLTPQEASTLIGRAQAFRLQPGQVHHPQALMVICSMALARWIVPPKEDQSIPSRCGSFTLIAVPPTDQNFEQCLTLLGHESTFALTTRNEDADTSDDEDIEVPLTSLMLSVDVWGPIVQGKTLRSEWVGKFTNATRIFDKCAHPKTLTKCVPSINAHAEAASAALDAMRKLLSLEAKKQTNGIVDARLSSDAQKKAPSETPRRNLTPPEAEKQSDDNEEEQEPPPTSEPRMLLAPSDMSESDDEVAETAQKKVKVVKAVAAASSSGTAGGSTAGTSRGRAGEKRDRSGHRRPSPQGSDDDDHDEDDSGSSSSGVPSTDSEKESDDDEGDAGDAFASGVATSDDDDEEEEDEQEKEKEEQEKEKEEQEEKEPQQQRKKKQKVTQVAETEQERVAAASAELAAKDMALLSNMHEIAAQCYEHVLAWEKGARGPSMSEESAYQVGQDLGEIQTAKSPMGIVAAMSNLVKNLTNAHAEHFQGETCQVPTAHEQRLRAACNQAVQFSDATMVRLDKAIQELTEARAMGHEVLKQIAAPSASENATSSSFTA